MEQNQNIINPTPPSTLSPTPAVISSPIPSESTIPPAPPPPSAPKPSKTKIFVGAFIIAFLLVSTVSFLLGFKNMSGVLTISPTPNPTLEPTLAPLPTPEPTPETQATASPDAQASPTTETQTTTITPTALLDGFQSSNGSGNNTVDIRAGRNSFLVTRGFLSFDLTSIPKDATIENATLRLYQTNTTGSPYTAGGSLKVDHMDFGSSLENADYQLAPLQSNIASLATGGEVEWKEAVVTDAIRTDIQTSRTRSQYRIHFTIETAGGETGGDFAYFESSENFTGTSNTPQLIVKYH